MENVFQRFMKTPTTCSVTNTKLLLLCNGVAVDHASIIRDFPNLNTRFKTSKSVVSYRHLDVMGKGPQVMVDELVLSNSRITSVVKTYISSKAQLLLSSNSGHLTLMDRTNGNTVPVSVSLVALDDFSMPDPSFPDRNLFLNRIGLDRIGLLPFEGCELWLDGEQCAFCGSAPKKSTPQGLPNIVEAHKHFGGNYRDWWEFHRGHVLDNIKRSYTHLRQSPPKPHFHFMYMSENISDYDMLYDIALDISQCLNEVQPIATLDSYFNAMPPASERYLARIREAGYKHFMTNLEFYRREDFEAFCPGKQKAYSDGYHHMNQTLDQAVTVFGGGKVRTNFVLTEEQVPYLKQGVRALADRGVVSDISVFFPRRVSRWRDKQPPSIDVILDFCQYLAGVYRAHGFAPYCCSLSSRSSILNELLQMD